MALIYRLQLPFCEYSSSHVAAAVVVSAVVVVAVVHLAGDETRPSLFFFLRDTIFSGWNGLMKEIKITVCCHPTSVFVTFLGLQGTRWIFIQPLFCSICA